MNTNVPAHYASSDEKTWAILAHLSPVSGYFIPFGNILGPLIVWLVKKDQSAVVAQHAKDSLNFHISMMIWLTLAGFASIFLIGIPVLIGLAIFDIVATVIGTMKAANGERYKYPLTINFF